MFRSRGAYANGIYGRWLPSTRRRTRCRWTRHAWDRPNRFNLLIYFPCETWMLICTYWIIYENCTRKLSIISLLDLIAKLSQTKLFKFYQSVIHHSEGIIFDNIVFMFCFRYLFWFAQLLGHRPYYSILSSWLLLVWIYISLLMFWFCREMSIITLQCGNYANYVGSHFWNLQVHSMSWKHFS